MVTHYLLNLKNASLHLIHCAHIITNDVIESFPHSPSLRSSCGPFFHKAFTDLDKPAVENLRCCVHQALHVPWKGTISKGNESSSNHKFWRDSFQRRFVRSVVLLVMPKFMAEDQLYLTRFIALQSNRAMPWSWGHGGSCKKKWIIPREISHDLRYTLSWGSG